MGRIDPVIAHEPIAAKSYGPGHIKFNPDYMLPRKPDLLADWIDVRLDLSYGLSREKYQAAGYRLAYLVATQQGLPRGEIIEASSLAQSSVIGLVRDEYKFAVLTKGNQP